MPTFTSPDPRPTLRWGGWGGHGWRMFLGLWLGFLAGTTLGAETSTTLTGTTNTVEGRCLVMAVTPNPDDPHTERPAAFSGSAGGAADRVLRAGMSVEPGATVRTYAGGTVLLGLTSGARILLAEKSTLAVTRPERDGGFWLEVRKGAARLMSRAPDRTVLQSPIVQAARHQTDYALRVAEDGETEVDVFEGSLLLTNRHGTLSLDAASPRNRAVVSPGAAPQGVLLATNTVQWWLSFPAVLDPEDLQLPGSEDQAILRCGQDYAAGRYRQAVAGWPTGAVMVGVEGRCLAAALRLLAGDVPGAEDRLQGLPPADPRAEALRTLIRAVEGRPAPVAAEPATSSGWLAESYRRQARHDLPGAREAARRATQRSPGFLAAWVRLGTLELGRDDLVAARAALDRAQALAPDHVPALVLNGFVLLSGNRPGEAARVFDQARARDPALADAWFGTALVRFRQGRRMDGIAALETAVALEPGRALLRSYLAKALEQDGQENEARIHLDMARRLDPGDPGPWLYAAWMDFGRNRVNAAMTNLQGAIERNGNRQVFRSGAQIDQDRAVQSSSLARLYDRAGLPETAWGEGARAVAADPTDAAAHLFLAESLNLRRDPSRFELREETAWFNEVLLANLLSPVGGGIVSPSLVGQQHGRAFPRDGVRLVSWGEARSDGRYRQLATQSGAFGGTEYALDLDWEHQDGTRPNHELDRTEVYAQVKQQVGLRDTAMLLLKHQDYRSGDNFAYRDPAEARPEYRFEERQDPLAVGLWRHVWSPGHQTLALAGRLENAQSFRDTATTNILVLQQRPGGAPDGLAALRPLSVAYDNRFEAWLGEWSQLARWGAHQWQAGVRALRGEIAAHDRQSGDPATAIHFGAPPGTGLYHHAGIDEPVQHLALYAYDTWEVRSGLHLTAGVSWEEREQPANFRHPPLAPGSETQSRLLPKTALVWDVTRWMTARGMFAQSLGGVTFEESYRLEPVHLAGFSQAARTAIPESSGVGSVSGHRLDRAGAAVDLRLPAAWYATLEGTATWSEVDRTLGIYTFDTSRARIPPGASGQAREMLAFEEWGMRATLSRLFGSHASASAGYEYLGSDLGRRLPGWAYETPSSAELHVVRGRAAWNVPGGLFARAEAAWYSQSSDPGPEGRENHTQVNLELGWRCPRQKGAVSMGVLNLLDDDHRLSPLSGLGELPRTRTWFVRLSLDL